MNYVAHLRCLRCGELYSQADIDYVCSCRPNLGSDLGTLDVVYDLAAIAAATSPAASISAPLATSVSRIARNGR